MENVKGRKNSLFIKEYYYIQMFTTRQHVYNPGAYIQCKCLLSTGAN